MSEVLLGKPTDTGIYLVRCRESDYQWESVIVTRNPRGLVVHCLYLGPTDLDRYHDGLTEIEWKVPQ